MQTPRQADCVLAAFASPAQIVLGSADQPKGVRITRRMVDQMAASGYVQAKHWPELLRISRAVGASLTLEHFTAHLADRAHQTAE